LNILNHPVAKCINDFRGARPDVDLSGNDIDAGPGGDANAAMDPGRRSIGAEQTGAGGSGGVLGVLARRAGSVRRIPWRR